MELVKFNPDTPDVIVVDGLWGSGKSLLAPIVGSLRGVGVFRIDPEIEHLTTMRALGKIDHDAYKFLILNGVILKYYDNVIGREVNLRFRDDSGAFGNGSGFSTLCKLFSNGGDTALIQAQQGNTAYFVMTHLLTSVASNLMEVVGGKVRLINVQRDPLYMVSHWANYLRTFNRSREGTISTFLVGSKVPWFAAEWATEFTNATILERALLSIARCSERERVELAAMKEAQYPIITVRLDTVISDPERTVKDLVQFLGRDSTRQTQQQLHRLGLVPSIRSTLGLKKNRPESSPIIKRKLASHFETESRPKVWAEFSRCLSIYES